MAGVGGVLTKFAEQVTPGDVLGFFENQNTSELGKLLQKEAISPEMYMRGTMIQQMGDIAKGIIGNNREANEARERVQTLGMQLARFAIEKLSSLQDKALVLAEANQKIIREIVGENSEVGKTIASCYQTHMTALAEAFKVTDVELRTLMIDNYNRAFEGTRASLDAITKGNVEIVKAGAIDPAFFDACAKQTGLIISQVNQLAIELARTQDGDFKVLASEVGQTVRCLITEGKGLTQSFIPWARSSAPPAVTGPSTPSSAPAIKGPEAPTTTSTAVETPSTPGQSEPTSSSTSSSSSSSTSSSSSSSTSSSSTPSSSSRWDE